MTILTYLSRRGSDMMFIQLKRYVYCRQENNKCSECDKFTFISQKIKVNCYFINYFVQKSIPDSYKLIQGHSKIMFKKRIVNVTKPIVGSLQQQVNNPTNARMMIDKQLQEQQKEEVNQIQHKDIRVQKQQKKVQDEDKQFLQRLKLDKKINDLFDNLQAKEKDIQTSQYQNSQFGLNQLNQVKRKPVKFVPYTKKKINFTFTQVDNPSKDSLNQKKHLKPFGAQPTQERAIQQNPPRDTEMQDIFRQIRQQNKKKQQPDLSHSLKQNKPKQQQPITLPTPPPKLNQFIIIEDNDEYIQQLPQQQFTYHQAMAVQGHDGQLKVAVDYEGNFSPQLSQHEEDKGDFHDDDYEDQLIRKTLTRNNYLRLQQKSNLKQTKVAQKKEKLFNTILKTSWNQIEVKLSSDINQKLTTKNQLVQEMKYLQERISQRASQVTKKKQVLTQLETEQQRLKKIIYFLCYFGDQVCGKNQSIDTFFNDLTPNIMEKILKICEKINIEEFMQKKRNREQLREQYHQGRKKIKGNQKIQDEQQINEEKNEEDEDEDDQFFMDDDDF